MDIKRIIKECCEQLYAHKFDNLHEVNQFYQRHNLPKLIQEQIHNLNRPISIKEIEPIINNLPKQKAPGPHGFTGEFHQTFKEETIPILFSLFHRTKADRTLPNSFYEASITLIPKPDKDITRKENYTLVSPVNIDAKILNKMLD